MDFLDPNNDCGMIVLKLAARGSSIIAELLRLSNHIPEVFLANAMPQPSPTKAKKKESSSANQGNMDEASVNTMLYYEQKKYEQILFDYKYLQDPDPIEEKIQNNIDLIELDEEFRESYQEIIDRFFMLFESVYAYYRDFK